MKQENGTETFGPPFLKRQGQLEQLCGNNANPWNLNCILCSGRQDFTMKGSDRPKVKRRKVDMDSHETEVKQPIIIIIQYVGLSLSQYSNHIIQKLFH